MSLKSVKRRFVIDRIDKELASLKVVVLSLGKLAVNLEKRLDELEGKKKAEKE